MENLKKKLVKSTSRGLEKKGNNSEIAESRSILLFRWPIWRKNCVLNPNEAKLGK